MEVIEENKKLECHNCHCILSFTSKDIYTSGYYNTPYIRCPVCGIRIYEYHERNKLYNQKNK